MKVTLQDTSWFAVSVILTGMLQRAHHKNFRVTTVDIKEGDKGGLIITCGLALLS